MILFSVLVVIVLVFSNVDKAQAFEGGSKFTIHGSDVGCDKNIDRYYVQGVILKNVQWFWTQFSFPYELSNGKWPNCYDSRWADNVYLKIYDAVDKTRGCEANFKMSQNGSHKLYCSELGQGLWIVEMRADYNQGSITGFTYVVVT